jgi:hypothetical protein
MRQHGGQTDHLGGWRRGSVRRDSAEDSSRGYSPMGRAGGTEREGTEAAANAVEPGETAGAQGQALSEEEAGWCSVHSPEASPTQQQEMTGGVVSGTKGRVAEAEVATSARTKNGSACLRFTAAKILHLEDGCKVKAKSVLVESRDRVGDATCPVSRRRGHGRTRPHAARST